MIHVQIVTTCACIIKLYFTLYSLDFIIYILELHTISTENQGLVSGGGKAHPVVVVYV